MSYRNWHVGMKVVCVDDSDGQCHRNSGSLKRGEVYTISRIEADAFPELAVQVSELPYRWYEFVRASRFRPVQPRKTDISIFTDMLKHIDAPMQKELS